MDVFVWCRPYGASWVIFVVNRHTGLSNKGEVVPVGSNPGLVEKLIGTPTGKNFEGLIIIKIQYTTTKIVSNIVSTVLKTT